MIISPNIVTEEKEKGTKKLEQLKHLSKKIRAVTSNNAILRKMKNDNYRQIIQLAEFHLSTFSYYRFSVEIEFNMRLRCRRRCKLYLKRHSNFLKHLEMALFFGCDNGIVNILFFPTSKIFPFVDSTFTLQQSFF